MSAAGIHVIIARMRTCVLGAIELDCRACISISLPVFPSSRPLPSVHLSFAYCSYYCKWQSQFDHRTRVALKHHWCVRRWGTLQGGSEARRVSIIPYLASTVIAGLLCGRAWKIGLFFITLLFLLTSDLEEGSQDGVPCNGGFSART